MRWVENFQSNGFLCRHNPCRLANILKQRDSLRKCPWTQVPFRCTVLAHLLELVFNVAWGALSSAHLNKFFCHDLPGLSVDVHKSIKNLFFLLAPVSVVVARVELPATQVVTRLHRSILETFCNFRPGSFEVLRKLVLGARAENGQHFHGVLIRTFLLFYIGTEGVHKRLYFLARKVTFLECGSSRFVVVPSTLTYHMEIYFATELYSVLSPCLCFSVCFFTTFAFKRWLRLFFVFYFRGFCEFKAEFPHVKVELTPLGGVISVLSAGFFKQIFHLLVLVIQGTRMAQNSFEIFSYEF